MDAMAAPLSAPPPATIKPWKRNVNCVEFAVATSNMAPFKNAQAVANTLLNWPCQPATKELSAVMVTIPPESSEHAVTVAVDTADSSKLRVADPDRDIGRVKRRTSGPSAGSATMRYVPAGISNTVPIGVASKAFWKAARSSIIPSPLALNGAPVRLRDGLFLIWVL